MPPSPNAPIVHLHLDITNHCNFRCEFCFHDGDLTARKGFMDTELALRLIDETADAGLASQLSTAVFGEALLHRDFFRIAEHAIARGLKLTLNTKGGLLDDVTSKRIVDIGVDKLIISLNTPDAATWSINHGPSRLTYDGHIDKIRGAIRAKLAARSPLRIFIYLMNTHFARPRGLEFLADDEQARACIAQWRDLCAEVAAETGVPAPAPVEQLASGALVTKKWPIDRGIELVEGVELVLKEAHSWGNRILDPTLEPIPTETGFCPFPWTMLTVHWDGECSLCCLDYNKDAIVGNVTEQSLADVFEGVKMRRIRDRMSKGHIDLPICQTCLGGLKNKATGEVVKRPQSSQSARLMNGLEKYGVVRSLQHGWQSIRDRIGAR